MTARHQFTEDEQIMCRDCSSPFTLTEADKDFFASRGLPKRCRACRPLRRADGRLRYEH